MYFGSRHVGRQVLQEEQDGTSLSSTSYSSSEEETDHWPADDKSGSSWMSLYHPYTGAVMRIAGGYMLALLLAIAVSIATSLGLQEAFMAYAQDARHIYKPDHFSFLSVVLIPNFLMVLSIICSECVTLCMDMLDRPPLPRFRSRVVWLLGCPPEKMYLVDRALTIMTLFSALVPLIMRPLGDTLGPLPSVVQAAMLIQLVFPICVLITDILARSYLSSTHDHRRHFWIQRYQDPFTKFTTENDYTENDYVRLLKDDDCTRLEEEAKPRRSCSHASLAVQIVIVELLLTWVALLMELGCFEYLGKGGYFLENMCNFLLIFYLVVVVKKFLPKGFAHHLLMFALIFALTPLLAFVVDFTHHYVKNEADTSQSIFSEPLSGNSPHNATLASRSAAYPICSMRWGSSESHVPKLTVIDVLVFAYSVYSNAHVQDIVSNATVGTDLEGARAYTSQEISDDEDYIGRPFVFEIPKAKLCVLAVRGTKTVTDGFADGAMWSTIKMMDVFDGFVPILSLLSPEIVAQFAAVLDWHKFFGHTFGEIHIWDDIVDFADKQKQLCKANGNSFLVTGHSLGGGLAQIIAARTRSQALVFSPVGVEYSLEHFHITKHAIMDYVVSVLPERDPVPKIDGQIGLTQYVRCNAAKNVLCHLLRRTACELLLSCGDPRHRVPDNNTMSLCS